jgi:alpha-1,3(6)-mannosylglycoprotein beta-1,6-N-acetyl-glucosaminyltransferase
VIKSSMKRPVCLLEAAFTRPGWRSQARGGGPMGEITVGRSLVRGLGTLGYDAIEMKGWRQSTARRLLSRLRFLPPGDFLIFDPWTLEQSAKRRAVGPADAHRTFVLDSFGIAPETRLPHMGWIEPSRVLTPFPVHYPWGSNTFLGFMLGETAGTPLADPEALLARVRAGAAAKERFGVLWAKDAAYLDDGLRALLAKLARICPIYATISEERGYRPGILPPGVENRGHLRPAEWQALLSRASFLIGAGNPVLGVAPLEALAAGCAYVNPRFAPPRLINGEPTLEVRSQQPYLESIPPPFVYTVDLRNVAAVEAAVEASLDGSRRQDLESKAGRAFLEALGPFTAAPYLARLRGILEFSAGLGGPTASS